AQYLADQTSGIPGYPCYRTVEETHADLSTLAADHPDLASWLDVGDSWEKVTGALPGYDLHALVLTNRAVPGPKPKFLLMAAIHARELATAELAARFAEGLVADYGTDPDVTWLLDYFELHVLPMTNPDGRKQAESGEYWRKNTDDDDGCAIFPYYGTDLNRNSSFHWGGASTSPCYETYQGPSAASEPE
ncbi:MAG: peptidase M14, partial [Anaerolineae bacterium]|nr:peptidase M14 [Anaerolineae bacterium]